MSGRTPGGGSGGIPPGAAAVAGALAGARLAGPVGGGRADVAAALPRAPHGGGRGAVPPSAESSVEPVDVVVDAAGAVAHPGVYRVAPHGRVADVLDAA